jgi:hypothetical protein
VNTPRMISRAVNIPARAAVGEYWPRNSAHMVDLPPSALRRLSSPISPRHRPIKFRSTLCEFGPKRPRISLSVRTDQSYYPDPHSPRDITPLDSTAVPIESAKFRHR